MIVFARRTFLALLLAVTFVLNVYHMGVVRKPDVRGKTAPAEAKWFDKKEHRIHHLFLTGAPYGRGVKAGELTKHLLLAQEETLLTQLKRWIPERWMIQFLVMGASIWFQGVEDYIEPEHLEEMLGISVSAPKEFDFLADGFTRQVAYHGLHEVGQMMVDQGLEDMGCTVVAAPRASSWIVGRNFDFEAGRIFDHEKVVKWVTPNRGYPYVSVIWAGMVGAVTGVNTAGLYASINAAGSDDFARVATPSTLVLVKVLQEAGTVDEAIEIFRNTRMFITDIFVVADGKGRLVRVEKSAAKTAVVELKGPSVVANHLVSPEFANDEKNKWRREELTTEARQKRGEFLMTGVAEGMSAPQTVDRILSVLRDKGMGPDANPLSLGNRQSIDAQIATHAVIYDGENGTLYVSQGPALVGGFTGYNVKESFAFQQPVVAAELPADTALTAQDFALLKETNSLIVQAHRLVKKQDCAEALQILDILDPKLREQSPYYFALGDAYKCAFRDEEARQAWETALRLNPAYARETRELKRRLNL